MLGTLELTAAPTSRTHYRWGAMRFEATANSVAGETAKGTETHDGMVAADPSVLPLGSVIRVSGAGPHSGRYVVTNTGSKVIGRHIDVYMHSTAEAKEFGKKTVLVRVLVRGNNAKNDRKEVTPVKVAEK